MPSSNLFTRHESKFLARVPEKGGGVKFMEVWNISFFQKKSIHLQIFETNFEFYINPFRPFVRLYFYVNIKLYKPSPISNQYFIIVRITRITFEFIIIKKIQLDLNPYRNIVIFFEIPPLHIYPPTSPIYRGRPVLFRGARGKCVIQMSYGSSIALLGSRC